MQRANTSVIVTHIASWLLFISLPVVFITSQSGDTRTLSILSSSTYWLFFLFFIGLFYLHTYFLFPQFYKHQQKPFYFLSVALLFVVLLWLKPFDKLMNNLHQQLQQRQKTEQKEKGNQRSPGDRFNHHPPADENNDDPHFPPPDSLHPAPGHRVDIMSIFMFVIIIAISISTDVSKRLRAAAQQAATAEAEKANAELSVLKAQVNPHFLFNTLNNIYSLAVTHDENTAESIMKLSNIMRYATDDAPENFVPLQKEIDCITDFIDLQKLRTGSKATLHFEVNGSTVERYIAPFVLLTFIENAFKYGVSKHAVAPIKIRLSVLDDGIHFLCSNPLPDSKPDDRKGTGIANVKKRLLYLYPGRHTLSFSAQNNLFTVELFIEDKV